MTHSQNKNKRGSFLFGLPEAFDDAADINATVGENITRSRSPNFKPHPRAHMSHVDLEGLM